VIPIKQFTMTSLKLAVLAAVLCFVTADLTIDPALCKLDMVLCLDNSGSISYFLNGTEDPAKPPTNWKLMIDFSQDIVKQLTIGPLGSQVGLVDFGSRGKIDFGLTDYQTSALLSDNIGKVPFIGSQTNTTGGLYLSRQVLTDPKYGSRAGKSKIIVLITDGNPNVENNTVLAEAQNCRDAGIRVIVVGISFAEAKVMQKISYTPNDYVYAKNFNDLESVKSVVLNDESCKPLPTLKPTTAPPVTTAGIPVPPVDETEEPPTDDEC